MLGTGGARGTRCAASRARRAPLETGPPEPFGRRRGPSGSRLQGPVNNSTDGADGILELQCPLPGSAGTCSRSIPTRARRRGDSSPSLCAPTRRSRQSHRGIFPRCGSNEERGISGGHGFAAVALVGCHRRAVALIALRLDWVALRRWRRIAVIRCPRLGPAGGRGWRAPRH